jgi:NAD-dependent deacetylase
VAVRVLTQNIDGLHQRAGLPDRKVLELHGRMADTVCTGCGHRAPTSDLRDRVIRAEATAARATAKRATADRATADRATADRATADRATADRATDPGDGELDPRCDECGGIRKLATVLFGEHLDPAVMAQAAAIVSASPLMLAIGSTLRVEPAASLCRVAVERGARLVIVNRDPTPYDGLADEVIRADISTAVPAIADLLVRNADARNADARNPDDRNPDDRSTGTLTKNTLTRNTGT